MPSSLKKNGRSVALTHSGWCTQHSGDSSSSQVEVDKATKASLEQIEASFEANSADVVKKLLERVIQVQPQLHRNLEARS